MVKCCLKEIETELKLADVTPQWLLTEFRSACALARENKDASALNACLVSIAKFICGIAEAHKIVLTDEEKEEMSRIRGLLNTRITMPIDITQDVVLDSEKERSPTLCS
ncbi:MAG: hypothetical protein QME16_00210 [Planctomycetota bacterium]|nr:hypothetical protein [Planctomycetota bacterium]